VEGERFDSLAQSIAAPSRRSVLAGLAAGLLSTLPLSLIPELAEAKDKKKRKKKKKKYFFHAHHMRGNVVVPPGPSDVDGEAQFRIRKNRICATFSYSGLENPIEGRIQSGGAGQHYVAVVKFGQVIRAQEKCLQCSTAFGAPCTPGTLKQLINDPWHFFATITTNAHPHGAVGAQIFPGRLPR
jgi:hypothetical protein